MAQDLLALGITLATEQLKAGLRELERAQGAINKTADAADKVGTNAEKAFDKTSKGAREATREIVRFEREAGSAFDRVQRGATDVGGAFDRLQRIALGGFAGGALAAGLISSIDAYTRFTAQLKLAAESQQAYNKSLSDVRIIAKAAQADIGAIGTLYARIQRNTEQLGFSQDKVRQITEATALALKANGATGAESASAILQLSQAFGSGALRGEEFNAVNEAAPNLIRAIADSLGRPVGEMRKLAEQGLLTSEVLGVALPASLEKFRKEAEQVQTIGGSFVELKNAFTETIGEVAKGTGVIEAVTSSIKGLASVIEGSAPAITAFLTGLAASAVVAGMGMLATNIGLVASAVRNLALAGVFLSANPVALAILGIGAAVGGVVYFAEKAKAVEAATSNVEKHTQKVARLAELEGQIAALQQRGGPRQGPEMIQFNKALEEQARLRKEIAAIEADALGKAPDAAAQEKLRQQESYQALTAQLDLEAQVAKEMERIEALNKGREKAVKVKEKENEFMAEANRLLEIYNDTARQTNKIFDQGEKRIADIIAQSEELERQNATYGMGKDAVEELIIAELERKKIGASPEIAEQLEREIQARKRLATALSNEESLQAAKRAAEASQREFDRVTDDIGKGLAQALFSGGKLGTEKLGKFIKSYFQQLVIRLSIEPVLKSIAGSVLGTFGFGGAANAAGTIGQSFNFLSSVKSAFDFFQGGFTSLGNKAFELTTKLADFTNLSLEQTASLAGNAATFAQYAGGVLGGIAAGRAISGGYAIGGGSGNSAVNIGTAIGAIFGPLGALAGGALGGLANRAFGRKTVMGASGIEGTFNTEGFSGSAFQDITQKGGWFRSSRSFTRYSAIAGEALDALGNAMQSATQQFKQSAQVIGIDVTQALNSFSLSGRFSVSSQESFAATLKQVSDAMIEKAIPALKEFQAQGESLLDTAKRIASATATANQISIALGTSSRFFLSNAEQALSLIGNLGEQGLQGINFFVENFVPESVRAGRALAQLGLTVRQLGLESKVSTEITREQFRALVEGVDASTEAGQRELAALLQLAPMIDQIIEARGDEAVAVESLLDSIQNLIADITRDATEAIDKQISNSKRAADAARAAAADFKNLADSLRKTGADLFGRASGASAGDAFASTLRNALTGDRAALAELGGVATRAFEELQQNAVSATDVARQSSIMERQLNEAARVADVLGVNADYQAKLFDVQTAVLEVLREELESGGINEQRLREIIEALGRVQGAINLSAGLTVDELLGVQGNILGQTDITQIVASATEGSETLLNAVLNRLSQGDTGSSNIVTQLQRGTMEVTSYIDKLISAVRQQSEAQAAELKRQRDLQSAQSKLVELAQAREKAIGEVQAAAAKINPLASASGLAALNNAQGGGASFGVNSRGLFESDYAYITYYVGREQTATNFRNEFYKSGGLYDQTYGRAGELQNYLTELEAQRQLIRDLGGIPQFAMGGMHTGGLRIVGERGPELEATGPARYWNAGMTAQMMGGGANAAMVAKLERLCAEIAGFREESQMGIYQVARNTGSVDRRLERWDDGDRCRISIDQEEGETVNVTVTP